MPDLTLSKPQCDVYEKLLSRASEVLTLPRGHTLQGTELGAPLTSQPQYGLSREAERTKDGPPHPQGSSSEAPSSGSLGLGSGQGACQQGVEKKNGGAKF